jgi:molybdenum cofactor biosynthesis enzyme MoaA
MPGAQLSWPMVRDLLDDCKQNDIRYVRLYGGEPLLHKDLPRIVEYAVNLGLHPWLTTNGILLKERIDDLYKAGLRDRCRLLWNRRGLQHVCSTERTVCPN